MDNYYWERSAVDALRSPKPEVMAILTRLVAYGNAELTPDVPTPVAIKLKWSEIVEALIRE